MPGALDTGIDISDAMGDIAELEGNLDVLRGTLQREVDAAVEETAREFRDEVKNNIKGSRIDSDTGELLESWVVRPKGMGRYEVRSTADHAVYLELGTRAHQITGNPYLIFEPEPGTHGQYPDEVIREDGLVQMHSVQHPGNDAYRYFEAAFRSKSWRTTLNNRIRAAVNRAMDQAGFPT